MKNETPSRENQYVILPIVTADSYPMYQIHILIKEKPIPFHIENQPLIYKEKDQATANVLLLLKYSNSFRSKIFDKDSVRFEGDTITVIPSKLLDIKNKYEIVGLDSFEGTTIAKLNNEL